MSEVAEASVIDETPKGIYSYCAKGGERTTPDRSFVCAEHKGTEGAYWFCAHCGKQWDAESTCWVCWDCLTYVSPKNRHHLTPPPDTMTIRIQVKADLVSERFLAEHLLELEGVVGVGFL